MAKYSIELREIVSTFGEEEVRAYFEDYDLSDYLTEQEIQVIQEKGVWSKEQLSKRIVDHFFLREIGVNSVGAFVHYARVMMAEIMETYAPLIYSASIQYDPLVNVDFTETFDRTSDNESQSNSSSTSNTSGLTVNSDTPQGQISKNAILNGSYASSTGANESDNTIADQSSNSGSGTEHYTKTTRGNSGVSATAQHMVQQYRDNIRALNSEIIYQLEPLFMGVY